MRLTPGLAGFLSEARRGWPVLLTALVGNGLGMAGLSIYSLPLFITPLREQFGWSATAVGAAASFFTLGVLVSVPRAGRLGDRYGSRRIISASIIAYAGMLLLLSQIPASLPIFYAAYAFLAIAGAGTSYGLYSRAVNCWFDKGRGLALGITMSGPGIAAALLPLVLPRVIDAAGWEGGYFFLAAAALCALPVVLFQLHERVAPASAAEARRPAQDAGLSLAEALRTRHFWTMTIGVFLLSNAVAGGHLHLLPMLTESGVSANRAQHMVALYGLCIIIGRLGVGLLLDSAPGWWIAAGMGVLCGIGLLSVALGGASAAIVMTIALGLTSGSELDLTGYLTSRYFGMKTYSELFGWMFVAIALGVATGPLAIGGIKYLTNDYSAGFIAAALGCFIMAIMYGTLGKYRYAER